MPSILFLFLKAFSATGGIEKVNRSILRVLHALHLEQKARVRVASPYAITTDERYFPASLLQGYGGRRWRFMLDMLWDNWKARTLLLGHINLAPAALLLKKRYPGMRIVAMTHGIEVWSPLSTLKWKILQQADRVIAVSQFTAQKLVEVQGVPPGKIDVLPNCLDPFFDLPQSFGKPGYLLQRYGLTPRQPVLLTLSRLNAGEGYKGYDKVLASLPVLLNKYPDLRYILAGKSDKAEQTRIKSIIRASGLESSVLLTGFLPDHELSDHYRLADVFVMPSRKEGFGLVFIEALACGTPVVAGNADGSTEALQHGRLGALVDPADPEAIAAAVCGALENPGDPLPRQKAVLDAFGFPDYKEGLQKILFAG